ncbi:hypothetical protein BGZ54_003433, partial [Gamsiella multidivaricata]
MTYHAPYESQFCGRVGALKKWTSTPERFTLLLQSLGLLERRPQQQHHQQQHYHSLQQRYYGQDSNPSSTSLRSGVSTLQQQQQDKKQQRYYGQGDNASSTFLRPETSRLQQQHQQVSIDHVQEISSSHDSHNTLHTLSSNEYQAPHQQGQHQQYREPQNRPPFAPQRDVLSKLYVLTTADMERKFLIKIFPSQTPFSHPATTAAGTGTGIGTDTGTGRGTGMGDAAAIDATVVDAEQEMLEKM